MRDNHSDIEDNENLSSESEVRSVGSSPSSLNCLNSLNFKSMASMGQERGSPPSMLSVQGSSPGDILMNGGSPNSSLTSVQAALAALKAGQMSLNQVSLFLLPTPDYFQFVSLHFFCVISISASKTLYRDNLFMKRNLPTVCFAHMGNNP